MGLDLDFSDSFGSEKSLVHNRIDMVYTDKYHELEIWIYFFFFTALSEVSIKSKR